MLDLEGGKPRAAAGSGEAQQEEEKARPRLPMSAAGIWATISLSSAPEMAGFPSPASTPKAT